MDFYLKLVTERKQIALPVGLEAVKDQLNFDDLDDDNVNGELTRLAHAATARFEKMTKRITMQRQLQLVVTDGGCNVELPGPPCVSIQSVEYRDTKEDDWETPVLDTDYYLEIDRTPALLEFVDVRKYVKVDYTAGILDRENLDPDWKLAILQLCVFMYENRGDVEARMPVALKAMIDGCSSGIKQGYWYE